MSKKEGQAGWGWVVAIIVVAFFVGRWSGDSTPGAVALQPVATRPQALTGGETPAAADTGVDREMSGPTETEVSDPEPTLPEVEEAPDFYYPNCSAARAAGAAPIHEGESGYAYHLDRDHDGVACE